MEILHGRSTLRGKSELHVKGKGMALILVVLQYELAKKALLSILFNLSLSKGCQVP